MYLGYSLWEISRLPSLATSDSRSVRSQAVWQQRHPGGLIRMQQVCPPSAWDVGHGLREAKNRLCQLHTPVLAAESPLKLEEALCTKLTPISTPFKYIKERKCPSWPRILHSQGQGGPPALLSSIQLGSQGPFYAAPQDSFPSRQFTKCPPPSTHCITRQR